MRVLLVEDDVNLVAQLKPVLQQHGYVVEVSHDGIDAEFLGREENFDAIILDLGLPQKNGIDVLQSWRKDNISTPVLILTARDSWQERVDGLKAGADDYLGKPFQVEELLARLEAILRRQTGKLSQQLTYQDYVLDLDTQIATAPNGEQNQLTAIEFRLLKHFFSYPGKILSKTELSEHVYEEDNLKDSNTIEVYINRLRKRFGKNFIETRRGQGYRLPS